MPVAASSTWIVVNSHLLTLDADSVLLREYCLRLTYHLELPGNERIAVIACGYADGYPRHAATGTPVLVNGVATFTNLSVDLASSYTLTASSTPSYTGSAVMREVKISWSRLKQ